MGFDARHLMSIASSRARSLPSEIVLEFLTIMRSAPIMPLLLRPAQDLLVRAGVDLTPNWVRTMLGLNGHGLHPWEAEVIRLAGAFADRLVLASNPAVQACRRMRLPDLYVQPPAQSRDHWSSFSR
jgi:uncharacterized protein (DUF2236 family)